MNNQSSVLLAVFVLLLVVLNSGCEKTDPASSYPEPFYGQLLVGDTLLSPVPQQKTTREFEPVATVETHQFTVAPALATEDMPAELVMAAPDRVAVSRKGDVLFLMDTESFLINKYNIQDGSLLHVITSAKEYRKAVNYGPSMHIIAENEIGVGGVAASRVMRIGGEGQNLGFIDFIPGEKFVSISGKRVWLKSSNEYELFHVYNEAGEKEQAFGVLSSLRPVVNGQKLNGHGLGFAGTMATDGSDSFVYSSLFGSALLGFKANGEMLFFREMIDPVSFPEIKEPNEHPQSIYSVDQEDVVATRHSLNVWGNEYYQMVLFKGTGQSPLVDAYDYNTGNYLYSLRNPAGCWTLFVSSDHIYANCTDRGFIQFERPAQEADLLVSEYLKD